MRETKSWKEASNAYHFASRFGDRSEDLREKIRKSPFHSYMYAREIGEWSEADKLVLNDPACLMYARDVIKGRWEAAESFIAKDPALSFWYAKECLRGRFEEGEDSIASSPFWLSKYAELIGTLPEKLHSVAALMSFGENETWIKEYFKKNDKPNG